MRHALVIVAILAVLGCDAAIKKVTKASLKSLSKEQAAVVAWLKENSSDSEPDITKWYEPISTKGTKYYGHIDEPSYAPEAEHCWSTCDPGQRAIRAKVRMTTPAGGREVADLTFVIAAGKVKWGVPSEFFRYPGESYDDSLKRVRE